MAKTDGNYLRITLERIEQFNEHMATVLDQLDYTNLNRIWIERTEHEVSQGRRMVTKRTV